MKAEESRPDGLLVRHPLLTRLGERIGRRRIPVILQMNMVECGGASLAMVLAYHGKHVRLDEVKEAIGIDRDGASALAILRAARGYGLRARGAKLELDDLRFLERGSILHWEFNHFVVFDGLRGDQVLLVDPALGRRSVPLEQVRKSFTGVALLFEPGERFSEEGSQSPPIFRYLTQALTEGGQWHRIAVLSLLLQAFALSVPVLTGAVVDRVVPRADRHLLAVVGVGLAAIVSASFVTALTRSHLLLNVRAHLDARMTLGFLEHLVRLPLGFFQKRSAGDLIMRLNSNATIREILTSGLVSALIDGVLVVAYLVMLLAVGPSIGLITLGLGALQVGTFLASRGRRRELLSEGLHTQSLAQSYQVEMLAGMESLKAMGTEARAVEHFTRLFVDTLNVTIERGRLSALVDSAMSTLRLASPAIILLVGATRVLEGELSLGTMLALDALALGFLTPLSTLLGAGEQFILLGTYMARLEDVLQSAPEQESSVLPAPPLSGRIRLEDVSFRYGAHAPLVVRDVSVDIEPGQFVAVVGPSGSGKSTLAALLLSLYRPTSGRITYDGRDLASLEAGSVRRQLGVVLQRPYIFAASVRANIALADPEVPLEDVQAAARAAHIHDEIAAMPMGYDSLLSDGGASISGGQRQRIALARALLRKPAILLLDEATSALDAVTEARVDQAIRDLSATRIVIAHRLSTVVKADLILMIENGSIVERGTHDELFARRGPYYRLVMAQMQP